MLGMRRVGITSAANALQRSGLIEYHRAEVRVLDRSGLEAVACSCYDADRQTYAELLYRPVPAFPPSGNLPQVRKTQPARQCWGLCNATRLLKCWVAPS
ncbi:MAG TPA: hypothetical protein DCP03_20085 [Polaromonas sp.]|nr:hypothetical protein [Polaromonas sp.]